MLNLIARSIFVLISTLLIIPVSSGLLLAEEKEISPPQVDYVALGDSLAVGITSGLKLGLGYSSIIAQTLENASMLSSYSNEYSVVNSTSNHLLTVLEEERLQELLKEADLVTISIGANDLIELVEFKPSGEVNANISDLPVTLKRIGLNVKKSIKTIRQINPDVKIYVMGYFHPFPHLEDKSINALIKVALVALNSTLEDASQSMNASFVPIYNSFELRGTELVPDPMDIHPSEEGYQIIASEFFKQYNLAEGIVLEPELSGVIWKREDIKSIIQSVITEKTITNGNQNIKRVDAAMILGKIFPNIVMGSQSLQFKDIPNDHPAHSSLYNLTRLGIFQESNYFNPNEPFTRAQMATVVTRVLQLEPTQQDVFKDVASDHWAKDSIDALASAGIINGFPDGTYRPNIPTTRRQFEVVILRMLDHYSKKE